MMRRPSLRARLASIPTGRLLLFLDYDGTLTPIVRRPQDAQLKASIRWTLGKLARSVPVVIISGRTLSDVQRRVAVSGVRYVASHGLVHKQPGATVQWLGRPVPRTTVQRWVKALESATTGITGALVEDKGFSVALHDRSVHPAHRPRLRRRALRALKPWLSSGKVTLIRGKRVLEARPSGLWNKGSAVARLLRQRWARGRIPLFIGDDQTDFDAFRAVQDHGGIAVRVGGRRSIAGEDSWVPDPKAVESLLRQLARSLRSAIDSVTK